MQLSVAIQLFLQLVFPAFAIVFARRSRLGKWLSPVVLCYAVGIVVANWSGLVIRTDVARTVSEISVLLAIPMLLYSTDLSAWLRLARPTMLSFALCVVSGVLISIIAAIVVGPRWPYAWQMSGMLVGVYTGGTPNMNAIGIALQAPEEVFVYLNAADVVTGGAYLLFLTSVGPRIFGLLLPPFPRAVRQPAAPVPPLFLWHQWQGVAKGLMLALIIVGVAVGLTYAFWGTLDQPAWIIFFLSLFSVGASFLPVVKQWQGTYEAGDYLLLIFCVSVGMLAHLGDVWANGAVIAGYTVAVMMGTILLHWLLAALVRIDRDTFIITSTAAIYGPPFIGQVAQVIDNRTLVFAGIATGLVGYAIGNFLGIAVGQAAYFLLHVGF